MTPEMEQELLRELKRLQSRVAALERQERPASGLAGLADVAVSGPSLNQVLQYGAGGAWENRDDLTVPGVILGDEYLILGGIADAATAPKFGMRTLTLANGATAALDNIAAGSAALLGMALVNSPSEATSALFFFRGGSNATQEVADPTNVYSATAGTASSTNIYWSAGNSRYEIQNNRGAARTYHIFLMAR